MFILLSDTTEWLTHFSHIKFISTKLLQEYNCFTMLCSFLLHKVSQSYVSIYPLPLVPSSHCPSTRSRSSLSTKLSSLCYSSLLPASSFTHGSVRHMSKSHKVVTATLSIHPTLSFPHCVHRPFSMSEFYSFPANSTVSTIFLDSIYMW